GRGRRSPATPRRWRCRLGSPAELPARRHTDPATWSSRRQRRANAWRDCGDRGVAISGLPASRTPERRDSAPGARRRSSVARRSACAAWFTPKRDVTKSRSLDNAQARVLEAPALVPGLNDVTVMGEAIEQRRGHLGIAESFMMPPFWNASCVGRAREGGRFVRGKDRFATVAPWRVDGRQGVRERDNGRSYVA